MSRNICKSKGVCAEEIKNKKHKNKNANAKVTTSNRREEKTHRIRQESESFHEQMRYLPNKQKRERIE